MPDPLPPTGAIEPAGYLCDGFLRTKEEIGAKFKDGRCHEVEPLYRRDAIAPLRVPLVDQHNNVMGHEHRKARELLIERVWTDKDGVVWSRPTAFAYAAVCEARHQWEMELGTARGLLAALVDAVTGHTILAKAEALGDARAYLDKPKGAVA